MNGDPTWVARGNRLAKEGGCNIDHWERETRAAVIAATVVRKRTLDTQGMLAGGGAPVESLFAATAVSFGAVFSLPHVERRSAGWMGHTAHSRVKKEKGWVGCQGCVCVRACACACVWAGREGGHDWAGFLEQGRHWWRQQALAPGPA